MAGIREPEWRERVTSQIPAFLNTGSMRQSLGVFANYWFSLFGITCVAAVILASCLPAFCTKRVAEPAVMPIQAELMADVRGRLLKVGTPVYARVMANWTGSGCILRNRAILEAHVVSVTPYDGSSKLSQVDLALTRAECAAPKMEALDLLLVAVAAPPRNRDLGFLSDPVPMHVGGAHGLESARAMQVSDSFATQLAVDSPVYDYSKLPRMHIGDVSGISGLKLSVGSGIGKSTVLTSKGGDVSLENHTLLLLVAAEGTYPRSMPESGTVQPASAGIPVSVTAGAHEPMPALPPSSVRPPDAPAAPPADDIDLCDPSRCNVALPTGDEIDGGRPELRISVSQLGYAPRPQKEITDFDRDETLVWLGRGRLLVAFNPHALIIRHSLGHSNSTRRVIRAALLDTDTRRITRTVDWELPDDAEYLWPLAENRVLVHVGSELRVYDEGLKITQRMSLAAPLAFVRVTPDDNFIAVGQVRERHSPELHAQLKQSLEGDPEEDVEISVLNRNFETIAKSNARTGLMPPTLLNEGQARLLALPNRRYRLTLLTWERGSSTLANFGSSCMPQLSSLASDLLFLVSCNLNNRLPEYRVLNSRGKLILKGDSGPNDLGQAAKGNADPSTFVVKAIRSTVPIGSDNSFSAANLDSEEFEVYRAADGKRLLGVRVGLPSSSLDGYALTADGSRLAVLTRDQISIYHVGEK